MMKKEIYRALSALLLAAMLSACSNEEIFAPETPQPGSGAIELTVSAGDFVTDGAPLTRATDNGNTTTFDVGDRIGLIIVADNGTTLVADNLPYKYNGTSWAFDTGNGERKTAPYYDNGIGNVTYIAYFPYSSSANGVKTLAALKSKFAPKPDQRSEADYRASDLLVWTSGAASAPQKKLDIALTHAYASISLSPEMKCTLADGNSTVLSYIPLGISDVSFTIGGDVCFPFQVEDGSFRCILPAGTIGSVRWFYTFGGKTYGGERKLSGGTTANTRYARQETIEDRGEYGLNKAQVGDFYCKNGSDEGYLIPGEVEAASLSGAQKAACLGIVYWVGDITGEDPLLNDNHSDCTHGLVVALQDAGGTMHWSDEYEMITTEWINNNPYKGKVNLQKTNRRCGYSNTLALIDYNAGKYSSAVGSSPGKRVLPIAAIQEYADAHPAPANSSGWYFPSVMELQYVCWGQDNGSGTSGRDNLNTYIKKVGGTLFGLDSYWSSTESSYYDGGYAWYVGFSNGYVPYYGGSKNNYACRVRPLLAF